MSAYYPQIDCVLIDADGERTAAASLTFDIYNVTTSTSEGTTTSNTSGIIASASLGVSDGDILEFSHGTYPGVYRCVAKTLQSSAFSDQGNYGLTYVVENLQTPEDADQAVLIAIDTNSPDARPVTLGKALGGTTTDFLVDKSSVSRTWRIYPVSQRKDGSFSQPEYTTLTSTEYEDVTISAFTLGGLAGTQTAATFFAGPVSGSAATPTFRAISMSDLGTGTPSSSNFLRGDGSWQSVSSGLTIGSTAISSGTDGRVLFQNAGVVSQDSGLLYDASTDSLTVGSGTLRMPNSSSVFLLATPHASYTGTQNVFIGASAGANNTAFHSNVYIGDNAGSNTSGDAYFNVFIGRGSGQNTQGRENVFLGHNTGNANTTGAANVFVGSGTGASNTTGVNNVIIGKSAGAAYNGNNALFVGNSAGLNVTSGVQNTLIGSAAGSGITSGGANTALGYEAGGASLTGTHESCVFIGNLAGKSSTGNYNVVIGGNAGTGGISGRGNIIMGYRAAYSLTTGALNVIIGTNEGSSSITTGEGNVFLGAGAGSQETGSNRLYIHNSNTTTPLIYGEFSTPLLRVHGNLCGRTTSGAQITAEYDGSNYGTWTVGSTGINTFDAVGSGAKFVFSDAVEINGSLTLSAQNIVTDTTTGMKIGTGTTQKLGFFNATPVTQRADIGVLTDSTGGTPGTTIQDVGGAFDQDTLNDNFASLAAQINALRTEQRDLGFMA